MNPSENIDFDPNKCLICQKDDTKKIYFKIWVFEIVEQEYEH